VCLKRKLVKNNIMPTVNGKKYAYTAKGKAAAAKAKKTTKKKPKKKSCGCKH
jgi:hypothetical protein